MLNGTNLLGKDNLRTPTGNPAETLRLLATAPTQLSAPPGKPFRPRFPAQFPAWIRSLPERIGARLYRPNDTEAGWWHWQITELRGGLARSYRDARFDVLRQLHELTRRRGDALGTGQPDEPEGPAGALRPAPPRGPGRRTVRPTTAGPHGPGASATEAEDQEDGIPITR